LDAKCYHVDLEDRNSAVVKWLHEEKCPWDEKTQDLFVEFFLCHYGWGSPW